MAAAPSGRRAATGPQPGWRSSRLRGRGHSRLQRGHLLLYHGPVYRILTTKRNVALLSGTRAPSLFTAEGARDESAGTSLDAGGPPATRPWEGSTEPLETVLAAQPGKTGPQRGHSAGGLTRRGRQKRDAEAWQAAIDEANAQSRKLGGSGASRIHSFSFSRNGEYRAGFLPRLIWGPSCRGRYLLPARSCDVQRRPRNRSSTSPAAARKEYFSNCSFVVRDFYRSKFPALVVSLPLDSGTLLI